MSSERGEHFTWGTSWATCSPVAFSFCSFCRVGALSGEATVGTGRGVCSLHCCVVRGV